ncbi:hypothetical protein POTOM_015797 [Populus tomentosa]|uniref:Knottins-like domain-containing protein n=1 Tax=Populus tomentosa TaxID=118781 RepID=A0A8X8A3Q1_POPTO|nr:hypothetical protein POTOM_015797 [Populus tomentosa]
MQEQFNLKLRKLAVAVKECSLLAGSNTQTEIWRRNASVFSFCCSLSWLLVKEMVVPTEARVCLSQSHHYKGPCLRGHNCAMVCKTEGFAGGECKGFRSRCFCAKRC